MSRLKMVIPAEASIATPKWLTNRKTGWGISPTAPPFRQVWQSIPGYISAPVAV